MKKINKHLLFYVFVILLLLSMTLVSTVFAKYIREIENEKIIKPESFYFNTNYDDKQTYELYSDTIDITVSNTYLGNVTESDVNYTITVKEGETVITTQTGTLTKSINYNNHSLPVEFDKQYKVIIVSSTPYVKTIEHNFITYPSFVAGYYTITDMGSWIELDLYIGSDVPSSIIINYISDLSADNTNPLMVDWYGVQGIIDDSSIINNSHYSLIFFKNDAHEYLNIVNGEFLIEGSNYVVNITK